MPILLDYKIILGGVAVVMTVAAHVPYFLTTLRGTNKPHIFTWVIWSLLTFIAFAGQVAGHAGPGAWVTGATGVICLFITFATFRNGETRITRSDWLMFLGGLAAIPLWMATDDPVWSIIIVTGIDCSAFYPTFRKSWRRPFEENSFMYGFNIPRHMIALSSLRQVSVTTALYPSALLAMNIVMYIMLKTRKAQLAQPAP
jgi:hypothetical protein